MKLHFILLVFLFSLVLFSINCSYAYSFEDFVDFCNDNYNQGNTNLKSQIDYMNSNLELIKDTFINDNDNIDNYDSFILCGQYNYSLYLFCFKTNSSSDWYTFRTGSNPISYKYTLDYKNFDFRIINKTSQGSIFLGNKTIQDNNTYSFLSGNNQLFALMTIEPSQNDWIGVVGTSVFSNLKFVPYPDSTINVIVNGVSKTFLRLPYSTSVNRVRLGTLKNFKNIYQINGYFGPWVSDSITDVGSASFNWVTGLSPKNGSLSIDSSGAIYINTSKLFNKQGYQLYISYQDNVTDNDSSVLGSWDFYSYYYGEDVPDTISGDSALVNPDLNSNVDVAWINAFGDLTQSWFDNSSGDIDYSLGTGIFNFGFDFSGDGFSGDFFNNLGFKDYTTSTYDLFIYRIYRQVIDVLNGTRNVPTLTFNYRGNNFIFNASDFTVPDNALKSFCSGFLIAGTVYLCILQLHRLLLMLTTLDLFHFVRTFDKDHSLFM